MEICPLCSCNSVDSFFVCPRREFLRCGECKLIFVPTRFQLSADEEKAEYDLHENSPEDPGYRRFLQRVSVPISERVAPNGLGLDFGSGPGPTLSIMFTEAGHTMHIYDPFYAPEEDVFQETFDFITATEVVEHLRRPNHDLERIWECLRPGGWLGIMTKLARDKQAFSKWHYKDDLTHISFFSRATFQWISHKWNCELVFVGTDVILMRKPTEVE